MTIPVAACWITFALLAREPVREKRALPTRHALAMLDDADARWLGAFYLVTFGGFVGFSGYLPIFFTDRFGLTPVAAASYAALCALSGSLLRPVGGALADRRGGAAVLAGALAAVAIVAAMLATLPPLAMTVVLFVVLLGSFGVGNGAVFQLVGGRFPHEIGAVTGLVGAAGGLGGFLLPFGLGVLASRTGSFAAGFAALASGGVLISLALRGRERVWTRSRTLEVAI
jgi:NNP family nitrate/nitrite transporter-like MFS transporter